ncbi:putative permease [Azospirillum fermentarium]|uniref:AEC family transporter n=1 Tax=Azospirillum fermentarium TaxID=1233114 RepID=UPI002227D4AE|nr:AEC family transporter [Azospirillum fermentarium]MCW2246890.1 putative permease [Azospirillum fermentarium]
MTVVFGALAPTFLLILLGYLLRRSKMVPDSFWPPADRLTYYVFFPCLIVDELSKAHLDAATVLPMALSMALAVLAAGGLAVAAKRWTGLDGPAFTSVFQGSIRPNTYVGLASARALYGVPGLTLTAVGIAVVVPLVNVLSVAAMTRWGAGANGGGVRAVLGGLVRNPLIIAALIGAFLAVSGIGPLPVAGSVVEILARAALPLGLLSVGAGLDLSAVRGAGAGVALAGFWKLLLAPVLTAAIGWALAVEPLALTIAVLFNALPCSASSYVLARQMGGDHRLMAAIITVQTLLAALTLPLVLVAFG